MATITVNLAAGQAVDFEVALGLDGPTCFAFGVRRSGSSLFTNLVKALCEANGRNFVDVSAFFDRDVRAADWQKDPALNQLVHPGNVYGGFRDPPLALLDNDLLRAGHRLLLVRDPRDALVSLYYAIAFSHPLPQGGSAGGIGQSIANRRARARSGSIDQYVLQAAAPLLQTLVGYARLLDLPGTIVYRYEDVIFDKRSWLMDISRALGWAPDDGVFDAILEWADVRPEVEDPAAFVRHVAPGDHLDKLALGTIQEVDEILRPALRAFGY